MKIYLFNPETGAYLGEDFADEAAMHRGVYLLPSDATTIAPPCFEPGQIPVFNVTEQCWIICTYERIFPASPSIEEIMPDDKLNE